MAAPTKSQRERYSQLSLRILDEIEKVFNGDDENKKWELLLRVASRAIPQRLDHANAEDNPFTINVLNWQNADSQSSSQLVAGETPTTDSPESSEVQGSSVAQESTQDNVGTEPSSN